MAGSVKTMIVAAAAAALAAGCNTFTATQTSSFADENGNILTVTYGQLEDNHETVFVSPVDGRRIDMKSRLAVRLELPGGKRVKAYQCMNMLATGTMYKTDDDKWLFHANGTTCSLYLVDEKGTDWVLVFDGTLSGGFGRGKGAAAK